MTNQQIQYWGLQESKRHNLETESLGSKSLNETKRHNIVTENLGYDTLAESKRHSIVSERETQRHNMATESLTQQQIGLGYAQLNETTRHNLQQEGKWRWDVGIESEYLKDRKKQTNEMIRHNETSEKISAAHELASIGTSLLSLGTGMPMSNLSSGTTFRSSTESVYNETGQLVRTIKKSSTQGGN
jgi:hypothetical protein